LKFNEDVGSTLLIRVVSEF